MFNTRQSSIIDWGNKGGLCQKGFYYQNFVFLRKKKKTTCYLFENKKRERISQNAKGVKTKVGF